MEKSKGSSLVVAGEGAEDWLVAVVVVPDRGGERDESLEHSHGDALMGSCAVVFQAELGFQGVVHDSMICRRCRNWGAPWRDVRRRVSRVGDDPLGGAAC